MSEFDPKKLTDEEIMSLIDGDGGSQVVDMTEVDGVSGTKFSVYEEEANWFKVNMERYMSEYKFENVADLQDLDRLLGLELLSYRYAAWLIRVSDYDGHMIDEKAIRDHKEKIDREIRLVKTHMGMGRKARIESENESTADYLSDLLQRAREFGVHRDNQIAKAIDLINEIKSKVGLNERSDEEEAVYLGVQAEQIVQWIREVVIPEYDAVDEAFRKNQKLWIRDIA